MLKAKIVKPDKKFKTQHTVPLTVRYTNTGKEDLLVLTRNTPLDSLVTDCLDVTINGKKVEYDGPLVKRAPPSASDYKVIKAGQSIDATFPVSDAYDTSRPGDYVVNLKTPVMDARPKRATKTQPETKAKLAAALSAGDVKPKAKQLKSQTSFKVESGAGQRLTLGASARSKMKTRAKNPKTTKSRSKKKKGVRKAISTPTITGGTAAEKTAAKQAHNDGYSLCVAALSGLANDARYKEWFGAYTAARFAKVKDHYSKVKSKMESGPCGYDLTSTGCGTGVYAYTYKNTDVIWFCDAFWSASATGADSKAGTVVHEHTHSDASTDDNAYGQSSCRFLATSDPDKAIMNADSHEYYSGG